MKLDLLSHHFDEWLKIQGFSKSTRKGYRAYLGKFIRWILEETQMRSVDQITTKDIYSYQSYLYYAKTKQGKPLSTLTQHNALSCIRTFFRFLLKHDHILFDPTSGLELPKKTRKLPQTMSQKQVITLLEQPDCSTALGFRDRTIMEVLYVTGMRNSELCNIAVYDVNIQNEHIHIQHGKGGKHRVLPLGEIALNYLSEYIAHVRPKLLKDKKEQTLFLSKGGRKISPTDLTMLVRKYAKAAGFKKTITPHTFRHSCATHMLRNGADIRYIQELLGHASVSATQIYTHVEVHDLKQVHRKYHPREQSHGEDIDEL